MSQPAHQPTIEQNFTRVADALERIADSLAKITSGTAAPAAAPAETPAAEPAKKPAKKPEAAPAKTETAPAAEKAVTRDDVRAIARKLIAGSVPDAELQDAIHEVAGVRKISEVPEDKLAAVHAKFTSMLP